MKNEKEIDINEVVKDNKVKSNVTFIIAIIFILLCIPIGIFLGKSLVSDNVVETDNSYNIEKVLKRKNISINDLDVVNENDIYIAYSVYLESQFGKEYIVYLKKENKYLNNIIGKDKNIIYYNKLNDLHYFFITYLDNNILKTDIYEYGNELLKIETINGIIEKYDEVKNKYVFHENVNNPDIFYWYPEK